VLNPDLDLAGLAEDFSKRGWVCIRDAFRADVAE
jgi:hypothetical protein